MMDLDTYSQRAQQASDHVNRGEFSQAMQLLQSLVESDLPAIDRAIMSLNMAIVCEKMGHHDHALQWYDYGIELEHPLMRYTVALNKADYLARTNRKPQAIAIYEMLLHEPYLALNEMERIRESLKLIGA
jgi:tetratricopeptide (TPR) repeat protein